MLPKILYPSDPSYTPASTPCGSGTISFTMSGHGVYQGIVNFTYSNGKFQGIQTESELGYTVNAMTNSNEISVQLIPPS
ncbi:MAG: hypothetical protein HWD59_12355 [Coxiellaceae bacterium]|nr:MAG: hypothetical protein HWD59_12355 [Coxiellaceae bacterium]